MQAPEYGVAKKGEKAPPKAKVIESAGKVMATVFWGCRGLLLIDYLHVEQQ